MKKIKGAKKALLSSVLALLLCMSMLIGTTFAWFTDSVTSGNNTIVSGNLDIELYYATQADVVDGKIADDSWKKVEADTPVFNPDALWEPGYAEIVYFKAVNEGSLALKYLMNVDIVSETLGKTKDGTDIKLSDHIQAYAMQSLWFEPFDSRDVVVDPPYLPDYLNGVFSQPLSVAADGYGYNTPTENDYSLDLSQWLAPEEVWYTSLVLFMPTTVGNEANHDGENVPSIDLGISLIATQYSYEKESDSFGYDYDEEASVMVNNVADLRTAINNAADGQMIILETGVYEVNGVIGVDGKNITLYGAGNVTFKKTGGSHIFNVANDSEVVFQNLDLDGNGLGREGIYVRNNSTVTLINTTVKNTGGKDIMIDEASDAAHGLTTTSTVNLINSHVEDVAMCASPVTSVAATQDTFAHFNYDGASTVGSIEKQNINLKPENMYINGDNSAVFAGDSVALDDALKNSETTILLGSGTYTVDNGQRKTVKIIGNGATELVVEVEHPGEGCDYGFDGSNVTFENLTITTAGAWNNGFCRMTATFNDCVINNNLNLQSGNKEFNRCTFNVSGNNYNVWTYGAAEVKFNDCIFNCDGKSIYVDGNGDTGSKITLNGCVFNDNGDDTVTGKAAIETGTTYGKTYELIINKITVNGFVVNPDGIVTNSTVWANKHSMETDKLNVVIDNMDVY